MWSLWRIPLTRQGFPRISDRFEPPSGRIRGGSGRSNLTTQRPAGRACRPPVPPVTIPILLAVLATLASIDTGRATTIRPLDLGQLTTAADLVIEGHVESVRSFWRGKMIWTEVTLSAARTLKGDTGRTLVFEQPGGRVDSPVPLEMVVPGAPVHSVGDRGFFFTQPGGEGRRVLVGLNRGRVPIRNDERGEFVLSGGVRQTPEEFAEEIRRRVSNEPPGGRRPSGADDPDPAE